MAQRSRQSILTLFYLHLIQPILDRVSVAPPSAPRQVTQGESPHTAHFNFYSNLYSLLSRVPGTSPFPLDNPPEQLTFENKAMQRIYGQGLELELRLAEPISGREQPEGDGYFQDFGPMDKTRVRKVDGNILGLRSFYEGEKSKYRVIGLAVVDRNHNTKGFVFLKGNDERVHCGNFSLPNGGHLYKIYKIT